MSCCPPSSCLHELLSSQPIPTIRIHELQSLALCPSFKISLGSIIIDSLLIRQLFNVQVTSNLQMSSGAKITTQSTLSICADLRGPVPLGSFRPILGSPTPVFHTLSPTSTPWHLPAIYLQTHPNNDQCMSMNYPHEIVLPTSWDHSGYSLTSSAIRSLNHCDIWS